jgi:thymidylate synthase ThyX
MNELNRYEARLAKERVILLKYSENQASKDRFATFLIRFPKILLQELNTHRQLVRNCGSSRAIPTSKLISRITEEPYVPQFTINQPGMVGVIADERAAIDAEVLWLDSLDNAVKSVLKLQEAGIHKQDTNRLLEPYSYVDLVLSGTDWKNFFKLRCAPDAQLAFRAIALRMQLLLELEPPEILYEGDWHIPFDGFYEENHTLEEKIKIAIARIARVSYATHGKEGVSYESDFALADSLLQNGHLSPLEHVAKCVYTNTLMMDSLKEECSPSLANMLKNYVHYDPVYMRYNWNRQYSGFYTYRHHIEDNTNIE